MGRIVVLGTSMDPHVQRTCDALTLLGEKTYILDHNQPCGLTIEGSRHGQAVFLVDGAPLTASDLIWDRLRLSSKSPLVARWSSTSDKTNDERVHDLRVQEWRSIYIYLLGQHRGSFVNHPRSPLRMTKIAQQQVAGQLGWATPPTLITSDIEAVRRFARSYPEMILKSLSGATVKDQTGSSDRGVMTTPVALEEVDRLQGEELGALPHFFQQRIPKAFEVRIFATSLGPRAFKINSQDHAITKVDWRIRSRALEFTPIDLDARMSAMLPRFLEYFELTYGSFDFVVDPDGEWWFLECNSDGQWGWLETEPEFSLSGHLAKSIAAKNSR